MIYRRNSSNLEDNGNNKRTAFTILFVIAMTAFVGSVLWEHSQLITRLDGVHESIKRLYPTTSTTLDAALNIQSQIVVINARLRALDDRTGEIGSTCLPANQQKLFQNRLIQQNPNGGGNGTGK